MGDGLAYHIGSFRNQKKYKETCIPLSICNKSTKSVPCTKNGQSWFEISSPSYDIGAGNDFAGMGSDEKKLQARTRVRRLETDSRRT